MSYNLHCMLHPCEDVLRIGKSLDAYSCFKFENFLQELKNIPRSGYRVLEQISNRLSERSHISRSCRETEHDPTMAKIVIETRHSSAHLNGYTVSNVAPNNYCVFNHENIGLCRIENIRADGLFEVRKVRKIKPLYEYPISSEALCSFVVGVTDDEDTLLAGVSIIWKPTSTTRKAAHFVFKNQHYFVEMIN